MMHSKRTWLIVEVDSADDLARMLTETTWCCCQGFRVGEYFWLNDSTGPDAAQEFAVLKSIDYRSFIQIESITMSWCSLDEALAHIQQTLAGADDTNDWCRPVQPTLQSPKEHGRCQHCA